MCMRCVCNSRCDSTGVYVCLILQFSFHIHKVDWLQFLNAICIFLNPKHFCKKYFSISVSAGKSMRWDFHTINIFLCDAFNWVRIQLREAFHFLYTKQMYNYKHHCRFYSKKKKCILWLPNNERWRYTLFTLFTIS